MQVQVDCVAPSTTMPFQTHSPPAEDDALAAEKPPQKRSKEMRLLADGTVMKVQRSRQRRIFSCVYCHSKKIRCSRTRPECQNCLKIGIKCKYFVNERVSRGGRKRSLAEQGPEKSSPELAESATHNHSRSPIHKADSAGRGMDDSAPRTTASTSRLDTSAVITDATATSMDSSVPSIDSTGPAMNHHAQHLSLSPNDVDFPHSSAMDSAFVLANSDSTQTTTALAAFPSLPGSPSMVESRFIGKKSSERVDKPPISFSDGSGSPRHSPSLTDTSLTFHDRESVFVASDTMPTSSSVSGQSVSNGNSNSNLNNVSSSVLQAPKLDSRSNNITNKYFNTNYDTAQSSDDHYSFNMSSFNFANGNETFVPSRARSPVNNSRSRINDDSKKVVDLKFSPTESNAELSRDTNGNGNYKSNPSAVTNFVDGPSPANLLVSNIALGNGGSSKHGSPTVSSLTNSLNPFSSNPATTVNYLYGTNVHYENVNLLSDLVNHLPPSRERSEELISRYVDSVHILLPVLVNLKDLVKEHTRYWDNFNPYKRHSRSSRASTSSDAECDDFNFLQFYTLYFPVLYASTISEFEEYDNLLLNQDIDKYLKAFNKICQHYNYPHGLKTIPLLLGNVIIQSTSPNPSTMEMSQIIRYAKFLQLHKDPMVSLRIHDWKVVKFRRMLWWVIFGLDALSSHNFCLPPNCRFDDFNVVMPDENDPIFDENGNLVKNQLNVSILAMTVKFHFDRILSDLVYHLHNGLAMDISAEEINVIKSQIVGLFHYIHQSILKINDFYKHLSSPTVQERNILNFVRNHSWSFADRAMMLLHKKILLSDRHKQREQDENKDSYKITPWTRRSGNLALSEFEDTFGWIQEANIITNFDNSTISQLRLNQNESFSYENLSNNLIPSILHNLNDFLKYNDFIKFGKFNWYIKRTIPLDSIILLFVIMCVKFKYEFMTAKELVIYVKLINKVLFIFNRKYFKNEKYKRMLSLTNLTWEYIMKKYDVLKKISFAGGDTKGCTIEFVNHQVSGIVNMNELFTVMDVPQPSLIKNGVNYGPIHVDNDAASRWENSRRWLTIDSTDAINVSDPELSQPENQLVPHFEEKLDPESLRARKSELVQLNKQIYYDLRHNFVDINDYCSFYSSLENVLHELMNYMNGEH